MRKKAKFVLISKEKFNIPFRSRIFYICFKCNLLLLQGVCWGAVFKIVGKEKIEKAFDCLQLREQSIGRYEVHLVPVFLKNSVQPLHAIVYYATPDNELFLGDDSLDALADDISTSCGAVGHNIEYLFRLSDFLRKYLPNERDEHVFKLDALVRSKIGFDTKDFNPGIRCCK